MDDVRCATGTVVKAGRRGYTARRDQEDIRRAGGVCWMFLFFVDEAHERGPSP